MHGAAPVLGREIPARATARPAGEPDGPRGGPRRGRGSAHVELAEQEQRVLGGALVLAAGALGLERPAPPPPRAELGEHAAQLPV